MKSELHEERPSEWAGGGEVRVEIDARGAVRLDIPFAGDAGSLALVLTAREAVALKDALEGVLTDARVARARHRVAGTWSAWRVFGCETSEGRD